MANTTIYNLPALNTVDSTSLFPLSSNVTATPTTYNASIGNIGNAITGNLRMSGDNLTSTNNTINISANSNVWNFSADGVLTLPGNIIAINYANSNRVTGNITFKDEIVIGTGTSNLISGLYLAPSSSSADANMYLRVRGNINDEPTHIHFDTGNNAYYNQFIGDDNKYIQLANTGNIVINSNDGVGNAAQWNFDYNGYLTLPADATISDFSETASLNVDGSDRVAQLYWNGNIGNGNPDTGGDYYTWAYVASGGFFIQHENVATSTDNLWGFGIDGNITLPTGTPSINYANGSPYGGGGGANTGNVTFNDINVIGTGNLHLQPDPANASAYLDIYLTAGPDIHIGGNGESVILGTDAFANVTVNVDGNVSVQANAGTPYTWTFGTTGNLTAPGNIVIDVGTDGNIDSTGNLNIISNANTWTFGTSSTLTLPDGGIISESASPTGLGNTIRLKPSGGSNVNQVLVIYPTAGEGDHLHLTAGGGNTELYLGNDIHYVKLATSGNVEVLANDGVNIAGWIFGTNGVITNSVKVFANLPSATTPGLKAFISDANLSPIGNFGVGISGGGSNYVPVFSDGANWCIG